MDTSNGASQTTTPAPQKGGNKTALIILALLIIGGIAWFAMSKKGSDSTNKTKSENEQTGQMQEAKGINSFKELMAMGKSQKCTIMYNQNNVVSNGTVYLADGMMRGDFTSTVDGKAMTTHMITNKTEAYTWTEGMAQGYKMSIDTNEAAQRQAAQNGKAAADLNQKVNYECSPWNKDSSQFTPPSTVNFQDFSQMMEQMQPGGSASGSAGAGAGGSANIKAQQCAACDSLEGAQKNQCKAALACE